MTSVENNRSSRRVVSSEVEAQRRLKTGLESKKRFDSLSPMEKEQQISRITNMSPEGQARRLERLREAVANIPPEVAALKSQKLSNSYRDLTPEARVAKIGPMQNLSEDVEQQRRRKIAAARTGLNRPQDEVRRASTVWGKTAPLHARGGSVVEVVEITGLKSGQVKDALANNKNRPAWQQINWSNDPEQIKERRKLGQLRRYINGVVSRDAEKGNKFVNKLVELGLITIDISGWNELLEFYEKRKKELPNSLVERTRMELFLKAKKLEAAGNSSLLRFYNYLGADIDPMWFKSSLKDHERLISESFGVVEDERGFYRVRDGRKWREPIFEDDGVVFDNSELARKREAFRKS